MQLPLVDNGVLKHKFSAKIQMLAMIALMVLTIVLSGLNVSKTRTNQDIHVSVPESNGVIRQLQPLALIALLSHANILIQIFH